MAAATCEQLFERAFPVAGRSMMTVAQAPESQEELIELLDRAVSRSLRTRAKLSVIQAPLERFPQLDSKFWHIPVEDSGNPQVVRFVFDVPSEPVDFAA